MIIIRNTNTRPAFNLAAEEYLTDSFASFGTDALFMLWRNDRSVIIGKNQNAYAEVDREFVRKHGIPVIRRLTGGGAVFHDLGNLNYSFITPASDGGTLNFSAFCAPVIAALAKLGIRAELSGRNDILAGGQKISGNAQCVRNGCVLHHGTLLWSADFTQMQGALRPDPEKLASKGIKSVASRVVNLRDIMPDNPYLSRDSDAGEFLSFLESSFEGDIYELSGKDIAAIGRLDAEIYSTWGWNWGKSPAYAAEHKKRYPFGSVCVAFGTDRGIITGISFTGDFIGAVPCAELEKKLQGCRFEYTELLDRLSDAEKYISGAAPEDIASLIFR